MVAEGEAQRSAKRHLRSNESVKENDASQEQHTSYVSTHSAHCSVFVIVMHKTELF